MDAFEVGTKVEIKFIDEDFGDVMWRTATVTSDDGGKSVGVKFANEETSNIPRDRLRAA